MNTVPMITPGLITGMTGLRQRPVFFLKLNGSATPNLVVKGERKFDSNKKNHDARVSVAWGSKLMKNVQNQLVNVKPMTQPEIAVFIQAAGQIFANGTPQHFNSVTAMNDVIWVKMPMVTGLSDADFWTEDSEIDYDKGVQIINKFTDEAVWRELGKIVAVDIFNGNSDRFNIQLGRFDNYGNVMFLAGGQTSVIGLDTFDPSAFANFDSVISNLNSNREMEYEVLKPLIDLSSRRIFAEKCTRSVGERLGLVLKAKELMVSLKTPDGDKICIINAKQLETLYLPYADEFAQGIQAGATQLRLYLQSKVRQYRGQQPTPPRPNHAAGTPARPKAPLPNQVMVAPQRPQAQFTGKVIPAGILKRMEYLGWSV